MKFGYIIPQNWGLPGPADVIDLGVQAEAVGYDSVWVNHHILNVGYIRHRLGDRPYYDALTTLTWVAARTERARLGGGVRGDRGVGAGTVDQHRRRCTHPPCPGGLCGTGAAPGGAGGPRGDGEPAECHGTHGNRSALTSASGSGSTSTSLSVQTSIALYPNVAVSSVMPHTPSRSRAAAKVAADTRLFWNSSCPVIVLECARARSRSAALNLIPTNPLVEVRRSGAGSRP